MVEVGKDYLNYSPRKGSKGKKVLDKLSSFYVVNAPKFNVPAGYSVLTAFNSVFSNLSFVESLPFPLLGYASGKSIEKSIESKEKPLLKAGISAAAGIALIETAKGLLGTQYLFDPGFNPMSLVNDLQIMLGSYIGMSALSPNHNPVNYVLGGVVDGITTIGNRIKDKFTYRNTHVDESRRQVLKYLGVAAAGLAVSSLTTSFLKPGRVDDGSIDDVVAKPSPSSAFEKDREAIEARQDSLKQEAKKDTTTIYNNRPYVELFLESRGDKDVTQDKVDLDEIIHLTLKPFNMKRYAGKNLKVRYYFAHDDESFLGKAFNKKKKILVGERTDLHINEGGNGILDGIFIYDQYCDSTFLKDSAIINPLSQTKKNKLSFLVEILNQDDDVIYEKWFGDTFKDKKKVKQTIEFERMPEPAYQDLHLQKRKASDKKVFIYNQILKPNAEEDKAIFETVDHFQPHLYEAKLVNGALKIVERTGSKYKNYIRKARDQAGFEINPMVSVHDKSVIHYMLRHYDDFAKKVASKVEKDGWDGIVLDIENSKFGSAYAEKLTKVVKHTRNRLDKSGVKKTLGVAVSPRYTGSAEHGYPHHAFYDIPAISKFADNIQIMAYDFHKGVKGPMNILPDNKIKPICDYFNNALGEDKDKAVFLLPFYGAMWFESNMRKAHSVNARVVKKYAGQSYNIVTNKGGERYIRSKGHNGMKYIMGQTEETTKARLDLLASYGIKNVGGWRGRHATPEIVYKLRDFK